MITVASALEEKTCSANEDAVVELRSTDNCSRPAELLPMASDP